MSKTADMSKARQDATRSPVAWFVMLERARERGDIDAALAAQEELRRLGVLVSYTKSEGADNADE